MKIARIIMNLKETRNQIYDGDPWVNHKKSIFREYESNHVGYLTRIKSIVTECQRQRCEIVSFPACTFIHKGKNDLLNYLKICKAINCVVSGFYKFTRNEYEDSKILMNGRIIDSVDSTSAIKFSHKNFTILMAISSTIKEIKGNNIKTSVSVTHNDKNCIIFDLGHHQYNGRYILTLKSVFNSVSNDTYNCKGLFLSFWKFNNGNIKSDWFIRDKNTVHNRIKVDIGNHVDYIDIIDV